MGGRVQRFVTNSEFDHVAMALKYRKPLENGQNVVKLYVLEATGVNVSRIILPSLTILKGVDIFSWDQFVSNKFHLMYEDMALRHLYYYQNEESDKQ